MKTFALRGGNVIYITVNQAGYNASDFKLAYVLADDMLSDTNFAVFSGANKIYAGTLTDKGAQWGKRVYAADFSTLTDEGTYTVKVGSKSSYSFPIAENVYKQYYIDLMSYYRMQRNSTNTAALMSMGLYGETYGNNPLVTKGYHPAAFLYDAQGPTGKQYDITGGWHDAGDYGIYSENQWVLGQMAVTYMDNMLMPDAGVSFDFDLDSIPDIINELIFSAQWSLKLIDADGGLGHNVQKFNLGSYDDKGQWQHPERYTGTRYFDNGSSSVEGSAKMAASLAATARALQMAVDNYKLTQDQLNTFSYDQANLVVNGLLGQTEEISFLDACISRAVTAYEKAYAYSGASSYPKSNYLSSNGLTDPLIWAESELYLLTGDDTYLNRVKTRIMGLNQNNISNTNYWCVSILGMAELYPAIKDSDTALADKIRTLLTGQMETFMESASATPYGVYNLFGDFGVNEPHMSFVSDAVRYYRLFKDENPEMAEKVLTAAKKGLNWVFGNNPWNISWVSGIGEKYTLGVHSRLDESKSGMILPSAMVSGALDKDRFMGTSPDTPWYADNLVSIDGNNWRYNEHSISIQIGLFNTVMSLAALNVPSVLTDNAPGQSRSFDEAGYPGFFG